MMTARNLGIVFGPGLIRPPNIDPRLLLEGFDAKIIQQIINLWPIMAKGLGVVWTEKGGEGREGKFLGYVLWGLEERVGAKLFRAIDKNVVICECLWKKSQIGEKELPISQKTMKLRFFFFF